MEEFVSTSGVIIASSDQTKQLCCPLPDVIFRVRAQIKTVVDESVQEGTSPNLSVRDQVHHD